MRRGSNIRMGPTDYPTGNPRPQLVEEVNRLRQYFREIKRIEKDDISPEHMYEVAKEYADEALKTGFKAE